MRNHLICLLLIVAVSDPSHSQVNEESTTTTEEISRLIDQLSAGEQEVRRQAAQQLFRAGPVAEPQLRQAAQDAPHPLARRIAANLVRNMERMRSLKRSSITIAAEAAHPRELFADLARQTGMDFEHHRGRSWDDPDWPIVSVNLKDASYWNAVKELYSKTGAAPVASVTGKMRLGKFVHTFLHGPFAEAGPFLISVEQVMMTDEVANDTAAPRRLGRLNIDYLAEPMLPIVAASCQITSARDPQGRALQIHQMGWGESGAHHWSTMAEIDLPDREISALRNVRGFICGALGQEFQQMRIENLDERKPTVARVGGLRVTFAGWESFITHYQAQVFIAREEADEMVWDNAPRVTRQMWAVDDKGNALECNGNEDIEANEHQLVYQICFKREDRDARVAQIFWRIPTKVEWIEWPFEIDSVPIPQ